MPQGKTAEDRDFTTTHATGFRAPQRVAKRAERSMLDFQRYTEVPATKLVDERGFAVMSGVQAIDGTVDYTSTAQRAGVGCYAPGAAAPKESQMQRQAKLAKAAEKIKLSQILINFFFHLCISIAILTVQLVPR